MIQARSAAIAGLAVVLLTVPLKCLGGGGSTWHVTVKNPSGVAVQVQVYYWKGVPPMVSVESTPVSIAPGAEHRFNVPGAWCPFGLTGTFDAGGTWLEMKSSSCLGHDVDPAWWSIVCANLTFEVCRKAGAGNTYAVKDFGFCKK